MARTLESIVDVFGLGRIQDFLTLLALLDEHGYTLGDLARHRDERIATGVARQRAQEAFQTDFAERARRCPACGTAMHLAPVNTGPRDQVGGGYRSQWICPQGDCMETIYNIETAEAVVRGLGLTPPPLPGRAPRRATPKKKCGGCNNGKA